MMPHAQQHGVDASCEIRRPPDLERNVHCLFGLPVDNQTLAGTKQLLRKRIQESQQTILSTINLNWVAQSLGDPLFRRAILNSDLVVIDGKPLLWLAQLIGCPMRETVPGSTLIQELLEEPCEEPLSIFLFGGEGNAAQIAMQRINQRKGAGLRAVGALNPGYGSVEEMSSEDIIASINAAQPDILLVALGATKGTRWIEYNRDQLNAKVISHLGATINFLAGTVKRAPRFMRAFGLEWVWRIFLEPKLFSRYAVDGLVVLGFIVPRIPLWLQYRLKYRQVKEIGLDVPFEFELDESKMIIKLPAVLGIQQAKEFRQIFIQRPDAVFQIVIDFEKTVYVDSAFWGLMILLRHSFNSELKIRTVNCRHLVRFRDRLFAF